MCLDKGNHNPPTARVVLLVIGLISLCTGLYASFVLSWCLLPSPKSINFSSFDPGKILTLSPVDPPYGGIGTYCKNFFKKSTSHTSRTLHISKCI